jgi:menaquinone-dependent protoporphyrinogen oxidase
MKVLVAFASKAGSTKGIAEFIGEKLRERGVSAEVLEASAVRGPEDYDAFVVGSAIYMFHWMKEAKRFVLKNRAVLAGRPVWLFSSGPVGIQKTDSKGRDVRDVSVSGPKEIDELMEAVNPHDHRVFFGALYGDRVGGAMGLTYRLMRRSKSVRESMPDGDYRDWKEIEIWANEVADALLMSSPTAQPRGGRHAQAT